MEESTLEQESTHEEEDPAATGEIGAERKRALSFPQTFAGLTISTELLLLLVDTGQVCGFFLVPILLTALI